MREAFNQKKSVEFPGVKSFFFEVFEIAVVMTDDGALLSHT